MACKVQNNDKEDSLSFFKPDLWPIGFSDAAEHSTNFSRN